MAVYVTGDTHGNAASFKARLSLYNFNEDDYVIICGDFGAEYGGQVFSSIKKVCKKYPCTFIILRGNHDTRYWRDHEGQEGWQTIQNGHFLVQNKYPNIWYVRDEGDILLIEDKLILFIPGAWSIDGIYRKMNHKIFELEEKLTQNEFDNLSFLLDEFDNQVDYIIGHTYPIGVEDKLKYLFLEGYTGIIDKFMENNIQDLLDKTQFKKYIFGHMHDDKILDDKHVLLYHQIIDLEMLQ